MDQVLDSSDEEFAEIANLCEYCEKANQTGTGLGVVREHASLYRVSVAPAQGVKVSDLESLLQWQQNTGSCNLSRMQRMYIALRLVIAVLPLSGTPWMGSHLAKQNVFVQLSETRSKKYPIGMGRIYIKSRPELPVSKAIDCVETLHRLGILLLELCFGRRLEDYPGRRQYLSSGGKENSFTNRAAAEEWQRDLEGEIGDKVAEAVRKCLVFAFETASRDLDEEDLARRFYAGVVEPMLDNWQIFSGEKVTPGIS